MDPIRKWALVRGVQHQARAWGQQGDIFAGSESVPLVGTIQQQHLQCTLYHDLQPQPRNDHERAFVKRLIRAAVLGPTFNAEPAGPISRRGRAW